MLFEFFFKNMDVFYNPTLKKKYKVLRLSFRRISLRSNKYFGYHKIMYSFEKVKFNKKNTTKSKKKKINQIFLYKTNFYLVEQ